MRMPSPGHAIPRDHNIHISLTWAWHTTWPQHPYYTHLGIAYHMTTTSISHSLGKPPPCVINLLMAWIPPRVCTSHSFTAILNVVPFLQTPSSISLELKCSNFSVHPFHQCEPIKVPLTRHARNSAQMQIISVSGLVPAISAVIHTAQQTVHTTQLWFNSKRHGHLYPKKKARTWYQPFPCLAAWAKSLEGWASSLKQDNKVRKDLPSDKDRENVFLQTTRWEDVCLQTSIEKTSIFRHR